MGVVLGFRPLTGIEVLNSTPYKWLNYAVENGICGADFIFRLLLFFRFKNHHTLHFHPIP